GRRRHPQPGHGTRRPALTPIAGGVSRDAAGFFSTEASPRLSTTHELTHGRRAATATRRGVRDHNMDAAALFQASTGVAAAAVVDGIGNDPRGATTMRLLAESAVRIGATKGALAGVLAAAALVEDPGVEPHMPDGVIVLALAVPGRPTHLA